MVFAGSAISSSANLGTIVTGNLGLYPGTAVAGFPPAVLLGHANVATAASLAAKTALTLAYAAAVAKPATVVLGIELGGLTLARFGTNANLIGMLTLDAQDNPFALWTFQIGTAFTVAGGGTV